MQYLHEQKASKYPVEKLTDVAGKGIQAEVDGHTVLIGTQKFMEEGSVIHCADLDTLADTWKGQAWSVSYIAIDQHQVALIGIVDSVKPSAAATVAALQRLQITPVMMTGDNKQTAQAIAKQVGISEVLAEVLPQDKAGYIKKLQDEGKFVAMVGDGVNDAPALAQADIGIAIGAGTDVAIETANIVLMRSDVVDVLRAIKLSKATVRKMKENLAWASVYNVLAIPIAAGVFYPSFGITLRPEFAALLMSLSSIIVSINAVLLKRIEKQLLTI